MGLLSQLAFLICLLTSGCTALSVDRFIPFGTDKGDAIFSSNDDNTTSIEVPVRFPFYDRLFTAVHINNNGILSFESPVQDFTPKDFPLKAEDSDRGVGVAFIAPFWADVDTRNEHGTVFFRSTTDQETLKSIRNIVSSSQAGSDLVARFNPKWALVATWEEVGYYDRKGDMQNNTFQVVVVTDGLFSFTIFNYAELTWVTGDASRGIGGFGGTAAMVGSNAGDGINFKKFKYSLTDRVVEVLNDTNMRDCMDDTLKGQYVYQIDTVPIFDENNCKDRFRGLPTFDLCAPDTIRLSPSFGAVHSGGFVIVAGPESSLFRDGTTARALIKFGDGDELSCNIKKGRPAVICPVPLFPPDGAGMRVVTLTVHSRDLFGGMLKCTYKGQYRVDPPQPFIEGNLMMTEEDDFDCANPLSKPVLNIGDRFCLTWKANEHFARDQIDPFQNDNIEVNVTLHYLSPNTTLANHGEDSGWKTIDLNRDLLVEPIKNSGAMDFRPLLIDDAAVVTLQIGVLPQEFSTPVPVLMFFRASVIGAGIDMFTSSPLVSFIPKSQTSPQSSSTRTQCGNIIASLEKAHDRLPCPATVSQAFLDPSLVVDSGCLMNPVHPNKLFNCHLNPGVQQCFLQRNSTRPNDTIVGQCCYTNGDLVTKEAGGHDTKSDPKNKFFEHFSKDLWPIIICCEELNDGVNQVCQTILNDQEVYFAKSFTQGYTAPQVGFLFQLNEKDTSDADLLTQSTLLIAPLNLTTEARERLPNASREKLYVCYRMHGVHGSTFSWLSHTWISINVQYYISVTVGMTHISAVGITLFDNGTAQCIKVAITAQQCSATINGKTASAGSLVIGQYQFEFTSTDKSMLIARQRRKNEFFPVVRVSCVPSRASVNQNNLYLYVSDTLPQSHGILGQLWNVPADVRPLSCGSHDLSAVTGRQIYEVVLHPNTTKERAIAGTWYPLTWSFSHPGSCIYAGNWFAGPNIIEGNWRDYIVTPENDLLATDFAYSKFPSLACGT